MTAKTPGQSASSDRMTKSVSLIAVDVGNTSVRFGRFELADADKIPLPLDTLELSTDAPDWLALNDWAPAKSDWRVASVHRPTSDTLTKWITSRRPGCVCELLSHATMPLRVDVEMPDRVGIDRLAGCVAANAMRSPNRSAIVIDAGTAITVDAVSREGVFLGGAILAGMKMSSQILAEKTDQLPTVEPRSDWQPPAIGRSTEQAIHSGLYWGTVGAIRALIEQISAQLATDCELYFTGGDAMRLAPLAAERPQIVPDLVLSGIALSGIALSEISPCQSLGK